MNSNPCNYMDYVGGDHYTAHWDCVTHGPESVCAGVGCGLCLMLAPVCD